MLPFLALPIAYLLGAIPFGYLLVKWRTGGDIRTTGSGNIGATNVLRTTGRAGGVATLLLDIGKGYLALWIAGRLSGDDPRWTALAALAVIAGHAYPVFLRFHGGKAVASFIGAFLYLTPGAVAATTVIFIAMVTWTRTISMGSICGAAAFPLAAWLISRAPLPVLAAALVGSVFIIYRHSSNIQKLRQGRENRFRFGTPQP
jgi:acyl phosphate:glycerol-3-phosphate acyltransferase